MVGDSLVRGLLVGGLMVGGPSAGSIGNGGLSEKTADSCCCFFSLCVSLVHNFPLISHHFYKKIKLLGHFYPLRYGKSSKPFQFTSLMCIGKHSTLKSRT